MDTIVEKQKMLPVLGSYDTVIAGGGIAGVSAALAAARGGNKVLLCERMFQLGGLATAGLITIYLPLCDGLGQQLSFGIAEELLKLSIRHGWEADYPKAWLENGSEEDKKKERYKVRFNASVFSILLEQELLKAGVEILYGTSICEAVVESGRIAHLILENKSGRSALSVGNVIDCTGDADICVLAGEETALYSPGNSLAAWYYYCGENGYDLSMVGVLDVEESQITEDMRIASSKRYTGVDAGEISQLMIDSHNALLHHFLRRGELSERNMLANIATVPQLRMTRRLRTASEIKESDAFRHFADSVGMFGNWRKRGPAFELPYAALHGKNVKNLAVAGRCISVSDEMWDVTRVIPVCAVSGEAVGTAAALAVDFDELDIQRLQNKLKENGVKLHL